MTAIFTFDRLQKHTAQKSGAKAAMLSYTQNLKTQGQYQNWFCGFK